MSEPVRAILAAHLPDVRGDSIAAIGDGTDHAAYLVDGELVVRLAKEPDPADVEREARLLTAVAAIAPLPVPEPVLVVPEEGCLAYRRLPGVPLLDAPEADAEAIAAELGRLLRALHAAPPERFTGLVERDDFTPAQWLGEAAAHYAAVAGSIPAPHRSAIEAFLAAPAPDPAARLVFSHNDLGIEHVLVDPGTYAVTGIIDWSDAALVDPARDYGLLLRDLGPIAAGAVPADLRERARFYARCALLEDLAYGLESGRSRYVEKSLAGLAWLYGSAHSSG